MIIQKIKEFFTKKIAKKILMIAVIFGLGGAVFFVGNQCFAEGDTTTETQSETEKSFNKFNEISEQIIHLCYMLLWPVIRVCGILLDNTMIYGTWLHLDISLWTLWNVMKNFANYLLGFMVIFSILKNLFSLKGAGGFKDAWGPLSVIKNTVIAGVLIQMSRFIVAALIDISSILTYSVGGLPTTLMGINDSFKDTPVIGVSAYVNTTGNDNGSSLDFYYTYGNHKIYKCRVERSLALPGAYIVGPEKMYMEKGGNRIYFDTGYCALGGWPYKYNHDESLYPLNYDTNHGYNTLLSQNLTGVNVTPETISGWIESCTIIPVNSEKQSTGCVEHGYGEVKKNSDFFVGSSTNGESTFTINNLVEQSKGYVGQLITMYASILDYSTLADVQPGDSHESYTTRFIDIIFRLFFVVILFIPLVTLAIVLVIRVGILWVAIIASPLLIILYVFKGELSGKINIDSLWGGKLSLKNIIALIFAPVIITFAISISLVFMSAITLTKPMDAPGILESFGIEKVDDGDSEETSYSILGLFDLTMKNIKRINNAQDNISYFIRLLLATGIIRFFLMAAFKAIEGAGKIGEKIQKQVQTYAGSVPIVPIGGGNRVGIHAVKDSLGQALPTLTTKMETDSNEVLRQKFPRMFGSTESAMSWVEKGLGNEKIKTSEDLRGYLASPQRKELNTLATQLGLADARELVERIRSKNFDDINIPAYSQNDPMAENYKKLKILINGNKSATDKVIEALSNSPQTKPNLAINEKTELGKIAKVFGLQTADELIDSLMATPITLTAPARPIPDDMQEDVDKISEFISRRITPNP